MSFWRAAKKKNSPRLSQYGVNKSRNASDIKKDWLTKKSALIVGLFNLLTPNVNYSGRIAPLTSKVAFCIFIQQI